MFHAQDIKSIHKKMYSKLKGQFTVSVCISNRDIAREWIPLISMVLFTFTTSKRKIANTNEIAHCEWGHKHNALFKMFGYGIRNEVVRNSHRKLNT